GRGGAGAGARSPRSRLLPLGEREVRLGGKRGDPDARQVEPLLVDDKAALPRREELPVEEQQVVELEMALELQQRTPLEALQARQLRLRREQRRERREVQRHAVEAVVARPLDRDADEPLVEAIRRRGQPRHRRERQRFAAAADREVEEAGDRAVGCAADDEEGAIVVEPEKRVERHHEAALRLRSTPRARELLELLAL